MKTNIFNTVFENMLRILLLLDIADSPLNSDRIITLDFLCIYGKNSKTLDYNLHGNNEFSFAEFSIKRKRINEALKIAVKNNYINVEGGKLGFVYSINERGKQIISSCESSYSQKYKEGAIIIFKKFSNYSDNELLQYINRISINFQGVE